MLDVVAIGDCRGICLTAFPEARVMQTPREGCESCGSGERHPEHIPMSAFGVALTDHEVTVLAAMF